ncbi:MAG: hypothetical protein KAT30_06580, partial [Candidatus Krumholzibacteria bacterium]|nr:hypothetical protein [Candidatus Krumholzibacteria bacterium]
SRMMPASRATKPSIHVCGLSSAFEMAPLSRTLQLLSLPAAVTAPGGAKYRCLFSVPTGYLPSLDPRDFTAKYSAEIHCGIV